MLARVSVQCNMLFLFQDFEESYQKDEGRKKFSFFSSCLFKSFDFCVVMCSSIFLALITICQDLK